MSEYLFSEQQEKRMLEISGELLASERIRGICGHDELSAALYPSEKFMAELKEFRDEAFKGMERASDCSVRNERLEMIVNHNLSAIPRVAHTILVSEEQGYTYNIFTEDGLFASTVEMSLMLSPAYENLVANPQKRLPLDDMDNEYIQQRSQMNKNMNEMDLPEIQPQDMEDCGDPAFKVLAEINRGRERMYITGNNYSGLMGPDETNSIDMLYACTNSSIFRIGPIELWSSSNPHYLDDASYEGFIEYLTTGTSSSKVDFFQ